MIQIAIVGEIQCDVHEGPIPDHNGQLIQGRTLVIVDRHSGQQFHVPMPVPYANSLGLKLQGKSIVTSAVLPGT